MSCSYHSIANDHGGFQSRMAWQDWQPWVTVALKSQRVLQWEAMRPYSSGKGSGVWSAVFNWLTDQGVAKFQPSRFRLHVSTWYAFQDYLFWRSLALLPPQICIHRKGNITDCSRELLLDALLSGDGLSLSYIGSFGCKMGLYKERVEYASLNGDCYRLNFEHIGHE